MMHISTTVDLKHLSPSRMGILYGDHSVTICVKDNVGHLLWGIHDWASAEDRFGAALLEYYPARKRWVDPLADVAISLTDVRKLLSGIRLCALGADCPQHRG